MISLIKNELYKLFHKKSTIIVLVIVVLFQILTNYIYSYEPKFDIYDDNTDNIAYVESEIKNIEANNGSVEDLVSYKTDLELMKTLDNYKDIEWKYELLNAYYYDILYNYYSAELITKDKAALEKYKVEKEEFIKNLDKGNWQYFATTQINKNTDLIKDLEKQLSLTNSKKAKEDIVFQIKTLQKEIELETYRLDNKVKYSGYLHDAINNAKAMYNSVLQYEKTTDKDEKEFLRQDVKSYYESMYILEHKVDVNNEATLQGVIKNLYYELSFMIFVFMIMISGSIVSEEFNKGTIKNLLTIPHTRSSILLSKYITVLLMIPFIVLFILLLEFIIGGAFFGFSSLNVPVLNYIVASGEMSAMNAVSYYLLIAVTKIPIVLLLATLAFSLSVLIGNTAFSIAITFCGYIGSTLINALASAYNVKFLNYFVTTNWDFSVHLFGEESQFGLSITHSIIVCLVYYIIMIVTDFIFFNKKNIKNI